MAGKRYSNSEISKIHSLIDEGLTNREIAVKLGRKEAGIRNLRYRMGLKSKAEDNINTLTARALVRVNLEYCKKRKCEGCPVKNHCKDRVEKSSKR